jgi:hypothetical protein
MDTCGRIAVSGISTATHRTNTPLTEPSRGIQALGTSMEVSNIRDVIRGHVIHCRPPGDYFLRLELELDCVAIQ